MLEPIEPAAQPTEPQVRDKRGGRRRPEAPRVSLLPPESEQEQTEEDVEPESRPAAKSREARRPTASKTLPPLQAAPKIVVRRGLPELVIGGESVAPSFFFGNVSDPATVKRVHSQMQRAARAGVRVFSTLIELVCPMPPDDRVYEALDERIERIADFDRHAYLMPRIVFLPMREWLEQYPFEVQALESGPTGEPSIASDHFWAEACRSIKLLIEHVRRTSYGSRVIGYHLERGEWFQPSAGGFDRSIANREGFRRWLRAKYSDSEVALRAAWYDGSVQFFTAEIPKAREVNAGVAFYDSRRERRWVDFMEYTSDVTADRIIALAETVKEATDGDSLVSVSYGYTWEFLHPWSGHLAFERILNCKSVDIVSGPVSYSDRAPGGSGALPVPVDSVAAHGKLWITEDDTRTHLASSGTGPDSFNPRMENAAATESVHARAIGTALAHQTGISWMDLWGQGWLDSDQIWARIGQFADIYERSVKTRRVQTPDVVALLDERSICHLSGSNGLIKRIVHGNREALLRCGATVGFYLQRDVLLKSFPTDAKLYLFLNPYRLSEEERAAIKERIRLPGRMLVWMFAVGALTDRTAMEEPTPDVVGLNLRPQPWNSEIGTRIVEPGHPAVQYIENRLLGVRERLSPSFYLDDDSPGITVLGEYAQTGLPSLVTRTFEGWTSVFCGEPALSPELLRGLCRFAGVHLYTRAPEDYVSAGNGWLSMHVLRDGQRTLTLPEGTMVYDVADGYASSPDARDYRTPVKARTTRLFALGSAASIRRLGFDPSRTRPVPQPSEPSPARPPVPASAPDADAEPGALVVAARSELLAPADTSEAAEAIAELREELTAALVSGDENGAETATAPTSDQRKRRRRRGGRGRGRRRGAEQQPADGPPSQPEAS
ncbi:MAG: hypothetical protein GX446_04670 [Chthonomonadales bacterium]|nr:hypothetical protein [Chthonomonadales bacterium]